MQGIDIEAVRAQAEVIMQGIMQGIMAGENLDLLISGALLLAIVALSLGSIWRNRVRAAKAAPSPTNSTGMMRWLTPRGTKSVTAEQTAIVARPKRKSGAHTTIRVLTPVSKVTAKLIRASADPMEIARKSGLSRDGVSMMMAAAAPKSAAKPTAAAQAATKAAVRQPSSENAGRAMMPPGAYTQAQRVMPAKVDRAGVGTRFSARVS